MNKDGRGWTRMDVDGCGWPWMDADHGGHGWTQVMMVISAMGKRLRTKCNLPDASGSTRMEVGVDGWMRTVVMISTVGEKKKKKIVLTCWWWLMSVDVQGWW